MTEATPERPADRSEQSEEAPPHSDELEVEAPNESAPGHHPADDDED